MIKAKSEVIVSRIYWKEGQMLSLFVREVSGGDIDGTMFRFEIWKSNVEDESLREESGDMYHIRSRYFAKLLWLLDNKWSKRGGGSAVFAHPNSADFNPEVL